MIKYVLVTLAFVVCSNAVFSQTDEKGIVLGLERSAADAFSKHNLVFLNAVFADNISVVGTNGGIVTKEQLVQSAQNIYSATVNSMTVRIEGVTAIVTGIGTAGGKDNNGNAYTSAIRFTDILLKTKGQWQIIARQETIIV